MYMISYEIIKFMGSTKKNWRVQLTAGRKITICYSDDVTQPYWKYVDGCKITKLQEKTNYLIYMDD